MKEILDRLQPSNELYMGNTKIQPNYKQLAQTKRETITAVDGGSALLLLTSNYCIAFVRIVAVQLEPRRIKKKEGYLIAQAKENKVQVLYDERELFCEQLELEKAIDLARKLLEWELVKETKGTVVWDGAFDTKYDFEKPPKCVALAKSTGAIGSFSVFENAPRAPWIAHSGKYVFAKLHKDGRVFRVDGKGDFNKLVAWSQDPVFVGYPYPLILADQLARVSNDEKLALRIRLKATAASRWSEIARGEQNSHDILDKIQY